MPTLNYTTAGKLGELITTLPKDTIVVAGDGRIELYTTLREEPFAEVDFGTSTVIQLKETNPMAEHTQLTRPPAFR